MIKNLFIQILYDRLRGMYNSIIITLEIQIESKSFVCFINKQMPRWNEKRGEERDVITLIDCTCDFF